MRGPAGTALLLLVLAAPGSARAEADVPEGCFCLRHVATDQVLRGCAGFKPPRSFFGRAWCSGDVGDSAGILMTEAWTVLEEGAPGCAPCQLSQPPTRDVPRRPTGKDDDTGSGGEP